MSSELPPDGESAVGDRSDRRADARRNHERVFTAAVEVFAERGLEATVPEIAARAGVGKATVYRSYPTKADLAEAVARHRLAWLAERMAAAARQPDAFTALRDLLCDISERLSEDRLLVEVLPRARHWEEENDISGLTERLIATARRQGTLRPDATARDIRILVGGYSRVLIDLDVRDPAQWRRYATLSLNALRP